MKTNIKHFSTAFAIIILFFMAIGCGNNSRNSNFETNNYDNNTNSENDMQSVWACKWCKKVIITSDLPATNGCPAEEDEFGIIGHGWAKIGRPGNKLFICQKCGLRVMLDNDKPWYGRPNCYANKITQQHEWLEE